MNRFFLSILSTIAFAASNGRAEPAIRWTMLNVTPAEAQADCHLLKMSDGSYVLIDAADAIDAPGTAISILQKLGVHHIELVIISHFHKDHYGRLLDLIKSGISVAKIALNVPDKRSAELEVPWGCNWEDVQSLLGELRRLKIPYFTPVAGERIYEVKDSHGISGGIDVLSLYDGANTPVGLTDVNGTSIVLRVFQGSTRVLFTGDLNYPVGKFLATSDLDLRADIIKSPHHGGEGSPPNEFYDRVGAKAILVPAPKHLWESAWCLRQRNYFLEHKIPIYVSGLRGNVTVILTDKGFQIETER